MASRLEGKVAVVTGGASGIGRACAIRFAREGADVVIADLSAERAGATLDEVRAAGRRGVAVACDVSREGDCEALADRAVEEFGRIDVLVAAAGILHARYVSGDEATAEREREAGHVVSKPLEYWEKVLAVNLTGTMLTDRAVARRMVAAGRPGAIVNIASAAAVMPLPGSSDYCVSKAGVAMLTKVLALELAGHGIRVNAIGPGVIATPMIAATLADEARRRRVEEDTPLGRLGEPEDIAATALFLVSDESSFMTGQVLFPTGGRFTG
jgi:NAD(P)-dependent dehydrogenase (short-subunit alcohol dehydrogenase family)